MSAYSRAGLYSNSAGPSRQTTDLHLGVPRPDAGVDIPLSEMRSSTVEEMRPNNAVIETDRQGEEPITADAVATSHYFPAVGRADTESRGTQMNPPVQLNYIRASSEKVVLLLIMFTLQAFLYIFFAVTLAGVGAEFLSGIPAIISVIGSVVAAVTVVTNFGVQVKEGRGSRRIS